MGVSIDEHARRLMAELDRETLLCADASARAWSRLALGCELSLHALLELLLAAKAHAVGDDFARGEGQGLRMWLTRYGMPMPVQRHLLDVDPAELVLDELHARLPSDPVQTRRLFWLVASLASFEGLRPGPRARAERLGQRLGLPPPLVRVMVEEAQITVSAMLQGDDPLLRRLSALRSAIFALE
jgi:hypothetical protein